MADEKTFPGEAPAGSADRTRSDTPASPSGTQSEWTASDRRGPLSAVPDDDDVERMIPGSEMDAEGVADVPTPISHPPEASAGETEQGGLGGSREAAGADPVASDAPPPPVPPPAASPSASRRSPWPIAVGLVLGGLIGAGSAAAVYLGHSQPSGSENNAVAALSSRVDALEKRPDLQGDLDGLKRQMSELSGKVATLEEKSNAQPAAPPAPPPQQTSQAQPPAQPSPAPVETAGAKAPQQPQTAQQSVDVAALQTRLASLQESVDALQKQNGSQDFAGKLDAVQAALTSTQALATAAHSNVESLQSKQQDLAGKLGGLQTAVAGAQKQASEAQTNVDKVQSREASLEGKLGAPALAVVADSTVAQIQAGRPFGQQVDALSTLGADPAKVAVLRQSAASGVPSAGALLTKFKPLEEPMLSTGNKAPANATFVNRLKHGLFGLVSVRRADETTGTDLPSRVALIEADLVHNNVAGAYTTWTALPTDAKAKSDAWGALAKTSVDAMTAARGLQSEAIGSLTAAKKS